MNPDLIVVADATRAHLYARDADGTLRSLAVLEHPQSRLKAVELEDDRLGHDRTDRRPGGVSFEPRLDPRRKTRLRFAHEVAQRIEQALAAGGHGRLVLFAASPFLGQLKQELTPAGYKALHCALDTDLTAFAHRELAERVAHALQEHDRPTPIDGSSH
jgi:protein required for attachment to host cells